MGMSWKGMERRKGRAGLASDRANGSGKNVGPSTRLRAATAAVSKVAALKGKGGAVRKTARTVAKKPAGAGNARASAKGGGVDGELGRTSKPKVDKRWFKDQLAIKKITQEQLANRMGLDPSSLSLALSSKRRLQAEELTEIARQLGQPLKEVMLRAGVQDVPQIDENARYCKIEGWVGPDCQVAFERPPAGSGKAARPPGMEEGVAAVRCLTAMSAAESMDGWLLFYREADAIGLNAVPQDAIGRLSLVGVRGKGIMLKCVKRGYEPGRYRLTSMCGEVGGVIENAVLDWAAPVLWIRT